MTNQEISQKFENLATALQAIDAKKFFFQIRSYQKAAQVIRDLREQLLDIYHKEKSLDQIEGIGPAIEAKTIELLETGTSAEMEQVFAKVPPALFPLVEINGLGVKRALKLIHEFQIDANNPIEQLNKIAKAGKIRVLDGFGEKSEQDIISAIELHKNQSKSFSNEEATDIANKLIAELKHCPAVSDILPLGSLRRKKAYVRDIDIGVATRDFDQVKMFVKNIKSVKQILAQGTNLIRVILNNNIQVDIKSSSQERWGAFLQHFTGSKEHNIKLREYALKQDKSLSEHGIKNTQTDELREFPTETAFYHDLGLKLIPPEERIGEAELSKYKL